MEELFLKFIEKINAVNTDFKRSLLDKINWKARLIGIKGARGIGKTTLLLQHIKLNYSNSLETTLYVSLDSIWFSNHTLSDLASEFVKKGGKYLYLDEVHKYPNWSQEIKNLYDDYPKLYIVFTGSSLLEILNSRADLSRRAIVYNMQGLSFREYVEMETGVVLPILNFQDILSNHLKLSQEILQKIKPIAHFGNYLKMGYYPFYREEKSLYNHRLNEVINMILEIELPLLRQVDITYVQRIKQLLLIISESVPFTPNVTKISEKIGINRLTMLSYLYYLEEAELTIHLFDENGGLSKLQKPTKIYLNNTNLLFAIQYKYANNGTIRETFFANQLQYSHELTIPRKGDFLVDSEFTVEVGGNDKTIKQLVGVENSFIAADDIEYGFENKVPLWLFGFLY